MMTSRKRQYYSLGDGNVSKNTRRVFLLRYEDAEKEEIRNEGPFANKEKAIEKLNNGILELNNEGRDRLNKSFHEVNEKFK